MTLQRRHKPFTFQDGSQIEIWQASWDISMERREIEEAARAAKASQNGKGDPELFYFQETIYASLASCSTGQVPDLERGFHLPAEDLDGWYRVAREMNGGWFEPGELIEHRIPLPEGKSITVLSKRPSVLMRYFHLDLAAGQQPPLDNVRREVFRVLYYPKLAGCSIGDVPSMEEARSEWGEDLLQDWYNAALQVIPEWFLPLEELVERNRKSAEETELKKKRRRSKSTGS